ncbi:HD domain-containing protein [Vibrio mediterranei]|nr:HD domain-containing protein [Vibrio mediterranei]
MFNEKWIPQFLDFIRAEMITDAAHDLNHVLRVVNCAKRLSVTENANLDVVIPAAYLHDCFTYPKDHPERASSSTIAAHKACQFLRSIGYPELHIDAIHHAIVAHSFSANIATDSIEARVVQDADRLDALGAIGVTRCIQVATSLGRTLYSTDDPFCVERSADDAKFTIDHFYIKLFSIADTMKTEAGKQEAISRVAFMKQYLAQLGHEIS